MIFKRLETRDRINGCIQQVGLRNEIMSFHVRFVALKLDKDTRATDTDGERKQLKAGDIFFFLKR